MIARKHRFHGHRSVSRVRGASVRTPQLTVFYATNHSRDSYRMAVVISKKIAKSAVLRNRIRRRLYEAVRVSKLFDTVSVDMVFVVRSADIANITHEQLKLLVESIGSKITDQN